MQNKFKSLIICLFVISQIVVFALSFTAILLYSKMNELPEESVVVTEPFKNYEIEETDVYYVVKEYIKLHSQIDDDVYLNTITESFINLLDTIEDNKHTILYYMAICSVESNFKMESKSNAGAIGISQIMYSVWGKTLETKYGFTKDDLVNYPHINIFAGYMIWRDYWEMENHSIKKG